MCQICQEREDKLISENLEKRKRDKDFQNMSDEVQGQFIEQWRMCIRRGLACPEVLEKRKARSDRVICIDDGETVCVETHNGSIMISSAMVGGRNILVDHIVIGLKDAFIHSEENANMIMIVPYVEGILDSLGYFKW